MNSQTAPVTVIKKQPKSASKDVLLAQAANELVFAVVGHVGSGTTNIATNLANLLRDGSNAGGSYDVELIKASDVIAAWAEKNGHAVPDRSKRTLETVQAMQDLGDLMRSGGDHAIVAKELALEIRRRRAARQGQSPDASDAVIPDGKRRAYILDSIRHPAEVELLRHVYQDSFFLIGVVCEAEKRIDRITGKYDDAGEKQAQAFMDRDSRAPEKHGQRVSEAFHLSDFFVDNTEDQQRKDKTANPHWDVVERLSRLVKLITHTELVRPDHGETAMYYAHGAAMRSACLSRQVGAALIDSVGNILATGTNEVPRAGGGLYGEGFATEHEEDHRCAYRNHDGKEPFCSNTVRQQEITEEVITGLDKIIKTDETQKQQIRNLLRGGSIGDLLEFSRAVHAEMDAILSAGRKGVSIFGSRLFVTTFPCHYCARHIVAAGVDAVQYIEPYPKSQALKLHADSIQTDWKEWTPPSEVKLDSGATGELVNRKALFQPFSGVAPRLYRKAFLKDRELKDKDSGVMAIGVPGWGTPWHLRRVSYVQLEAELWKESQ